MSGKRNKLMPLGVAGSSPVSHPKEIKGQGTFPQEIGALTLFVVTY